MNNIDKELKKLKLLLLMDTDLTNIIVNLVKETNSTVYSAVIITSGIFKKHNQPFTINYYYHNLRNYKEIYDFIKKNIIIKTQVNR